MSDGTGLAEALLGLDCFKVLDVTEGESELVIAIETTASVTGCWSCGVLAGCQDRVRVDIRDLACFGRPARLVTRPCGRRGRWARLGIRVLLCREPGTPPGVDLGQGDPAAHRRLAYAEVTGNLSNRLAARAAQLGHLSCTRGRTIVAFVSRFPWSPWWTSFSGEVARSWMSVKAGQAHFGSGAITPPLVKVVRKRRAARWSTEPCGSSRRKLSCGRRRTRAVGIRRIQQRNVFDSALGSRAEGRARGSVRERDPKAGGVPADDVLVGREGDSQAVEFLLDGLALSLPRPVPGSLPCQ
jgi:hypothetical protein